MPKPKLPRRTPLALFVAALAGAGTAAAQEALDRPGVADHRRPTAAGRRRKRGRRRPAADRHRGNRDDRAGCARRRSTSSARGSRRTSSPTSWEPKPISRVGDSTVSAALRRVPGLTLVNDQFIYVRGLGERYSSVQLNGAQVPSPDLTRNVIPLDIFPTEIIDALQVQKGYSPEAPAAFGGGNIDIRTRSIPNGPVVNIEIGSGIELRQQR